MRDLLNTIQTLFNYKESEQFYAVLVVVRTFPNDTTTTTYTFNISLINQYYTWLTFDPVNHVEL